MQAELIEVMRDQVCAIYRALTGTDMPEAEPSAVLPSEAPLDELTRSFADLEAMARMVPFLAERVPPFSFTPPLDAIIEGDELLVELALPGVERSDVTVETSQGMLVISGIRRGHRGSNGSAFSHAEIPRGPFYRVFKLPFHLAGEPGVEIQQGLLRVRAKRASASNGAEQTP